MCCLSSSTLIMFSMWSPVSKARSCRRIWTTGRYVWAMWWCVSVCDDGWAKCNLAGSLCRAGNDITTLQLLRPSQEISGRHSTLKDVFVLIFVLFTWNTTVMLFLFIKELEVKAESCAKMIVFFLLLLSESMKILIREQENVAFFFKNLKKNRMLNY